MLVSSPRETLDEFVPYKGVKFVVSTQEVSAEDEYP
jgi:hypothetical protein